MKYGTLWCLLFGHKCLWKYRYYKDDDVSCTGVQKTDYCVRCGQPEPQVTIHPDAVRKTDTR